MNDDEKVDNTDIVHLIDFMLKIGDQGTVPVIIFRPENLAV